MHSGTCIAPTNPAFSVSIGIASLVLEGRSVVNDEDSRDAAASQQQLASSAAASSWAKSDSVQNIHRLKQKLRQLRSAPSTSKDSAEFYQTTAAAAAAAMMTSAPDDVDSDNDLDVPMMKSATSSSASSSGGSSGDTASLLDSLQNLASTCLKSKPRSLKAMGLFKTVDLDTSLSTLLARSASTSSVMSKEMLKGRSNSTSRRSSIKCGFHCEQFLKKIGVIKQGQDNDAEHHCSDLAESCCRWQMQYKQMAAILSRGNGICIEVYLGPETQPLLLEQWIIQKIDKPVEPGMTLPSLCTAIRSQLHFSQITAWTDLLSSGVELRDNPRITFGQSLGPRLDIYYRVKSYDTVSNFENQPLIHTFPNVKLDDGVAVQVCLKSLPRLEMIPKLNEERVLAVSEEREMISVPCCMEKGKHRCTFDEESPTEMMSSMNILPSVLHREKQLQKYKKRLMRRDKKKMRQSGEEDRWMQSEEDVAVAAEVEAPRQMMMTATTTRVEERRQYVGEKMPKPPINDLRPPLYFTSPCLEPIAPPAPPPRSATQATQTVTMVHDTITVSTQTDLMDCFPQCDLCNNEMQYICWNCDNNIIVNLASEAKVPPLNKADLLLQAMQRTALAKCRTPEHTCDRGSCDSANGDLDCRLCKRQKIQHIYGGERPTDVALSQFDEMSLDVADDEAGGVAEFRAEDQYRTPQSNGTAAAALHVNTTPHRVPPAETLTTGGVMNTVKSSLSRVRNLPKINLSSVFGEAASLRAPTMTTQEHKSSPIPIRNIFNFDMTPNVGSVVPVQKSNSAPTFNGSHTLSPRFIKSAAIYKRRSRHLSDRSSERSSIGSDEQISDDDLTLDSPMTSPIKLSTSSTWKLPFGRRGLLGSLEESLLQRRIVPKFQVPGFRILLGASGSFCPTQLTIPAKTYFYEMAGQTISTPYVSEVRLSRKGYSIPRSGTIQVTLLNPLGTVVRMFVVAYDFRDMPNMATTFIRQRVLAFDEDLNPGREVAQLTTCEQMKLLRYVIHLKFQTSRSGRLSLHSDIKMLISRRTDCDTAAAHAKDALESPNELKILTIQPDNPRFSLRVDKN
ncbi:protein Atossa [Phlebotomus argentipes]|uniref:protein Atossa n=1 Tax=Phlebotomus argentipes TaxID=94469 RepID=UPI0028935EE9|nr:protein Atossa [Phlebotomus argentipes]